MYDVDKPDCSLSIKIMGKDCNAHYGHSEFRDYCIFAVILACSVALAFYFIGGYAEEREIMHEKINVMSCSDLTKLLSESTSKSDLYRAEQNYKWECTENKVLELES